ncbi:MAG: hypothetical protein ACI8ZB_004241 [Desulforhopalus sp.]|jgi:hypothetical protein
MKIIFCIAVFVLLVPIIGYGAGEHDHGASETPVGVEALSHDLHDLLSKEMIAIQNGMLSILPAYSSGNWAEIAITAGKIERSYILKQSLTESQVKELHSVLPPSFLEKDQRFHYLAGMLEHVAKNRKSELINFYFSEMAESCVSCHSAFATKKFPALLSEEENEEHVH